VLLRHDVGSRKAWLGEVLGAVRMALLPPAYLLGTDGADPLVLESFEALRILAEANRYSHLSGTERAKAESDGRLRERKHARGAELVVLKRRLCCQVMQERGCVRRIYGRVADFAGYERGEKELRGSVYRRERVRDGWTKSQLALEEC
jgi:hypothetical protein